MDMGAGIAAEFNPFHSGHRYIVEKASHEGGFVGAVMSGCFVQRGEPAVFDKFLRTEAALRGGVDIVMELPVVYALGGADLFAYGSCRTLEKAGIFGSMVFGSESGNIDELKRAAEVLAFESTEFKSALEKYSAKGLSYPAARERAARECSCISEGILSMPNNILGVEYIKQLMLQGSEMRPVTVKRLGGGYNDIGSKNGGFCSAAAVRKFISEDNVEEIKKAVPKEMTNIYIEEAFKGYPTIEDYREEIRYIILKKGREGLTEICDITEGLENSIYRLCGFESIEGLIMGLKSKRYTMAKLRRAVVHILMDIRKEETYPPGEVPYIRVLGVRNDKKQLLGLIKEKASVPIVVNVKKDIEGLDERGRACILKDMFACDLYTVKKEKKISRDFTEGLITV